MGNSLYLTFWQKDKTFLRIELLFQKKKAEGGGRGVIEDMEFPGVSKK